MAEETTVNIDGVLLDSNESTALVGMFEHPGYAIYQRVLAGSQMLEDSTFMGSTSSTLQELGLAQGKSIKTAHWLDMADEAKAQHKEVFGE